MDCLASLLVGAIIGWALRKGAFFFKLTNKEKAEYINLIAIHRNGREAIIINDNHYYDADANEEITDLVEYAENLHDYGYKLFS